MQPFAPGQGPQGLTVFGMVEIEAHRFGKPVWQAWIAVNSGSRIVPYLSSSHGL